MTTRDTLTVRPVRYTDSLPAWGVVLTALGAVPLGDEGGEQVYQLGAGRLVLHAAEGSAEAPGTTVLGLETSVPLDEAVAAAVEDGVPIELAETDHGRSGVVTAADGVSLTLEAPDPALRPARAARPDLAVMPVWHTPTGRIALDVLDGLGLRRRVTLDDGSWADLTARSGGLHAVRPRSGVGTELAFELTGDVDALLDALTAAGVGAQVDVEESGRVLRFVDPDGGDPLCVYERRPDLYSYALSEL